MCRINNNLGKKVLFYQLKIFQPFLCPLLYFNYMHPKTDIIGLKDIN